MKNQKIINVGVIAHIDAGKSTLVDAMLKQSGVFRENEVLIEQVMDSNDLERERGITIYSKNCAITHKNTKINIVDTPGHADFSSEVERIMRTVDTVILLVDSKEGPMPQTRVVLEKSLEHGLRPIVFINKIDKKDSRITEVEDLCFDLFLELGATDEQLDFPIVYGNAKVGTATMDMDEPSEDLIPLFSCLLDHVPPYPDLKDHPLQLQISSLGYDDYLGRLGIGRIKSGTLTQNTTIRLFRRDGTSSLAKIKNVYVNEGLSRVSVQEAGAGDMVVFSGIPDISIGETVSDKDEGTALPMIDIEAPTLQMNFLVNDSPFVGQSGHLVTARQIKDRLAKELETNVGLRVEALDGMEGFKVSGRGELHLSILLEKMRREGFELSVSKPKVLMRTIDDVLHEPFEKVTITLPDAHSGTIIARINQRKGVLQTLNSENGYTRLEYLVPVRGLIGFRSEFINATHGEGTLEKSYHGHLPHAGPIDSTRQGVLISKVGGQAMAYSLFNLSERGVIFISPATKVYEGMIIGQNARNNDLTVNPIKNKKLTNVRSSGTDEALKLQNPRRFTLEEALEFIEEDELVEITPTDIRLRKKHLKEHNRKREQKVFTEA